VQLTKQEVIYLEKDKNLPGANLDFDALKEIGLSDEEMQTLNALYNINQKIGTPAGSCNDDLRYALWSLQYIPRTDRLTKKITKDSYNGSSNFKHWFESAKRQCQSSADKLTIFIPLQKIADFCERFEKENGICEKQDTKTDLENAINEAQEIKSENKGEVSRMDTQNGNGNKPIASFKDGSLSVSLWKNNGRNGEYYSISLRRSYKDKDTGEWKTQQISLFGQESVNKCIALLEQISTEIPEQMTV